MTGPRPVATSSTSTVSFCVLPSPPLVISRSTPLAPALRRRHLRAGEHLDAAALEVLLELRRHRFVFARHQPRQQLDDGDFAAVALEDRRELDADGAAAHDRDRLRHLGEVNGLVAEDDLLAVDARSRARCARAEPVATMSSFVAVSVCLVPSCSVTSTLLPPVSRAVPLIQSILFFLNSISMPPVSPATSCPCARARRACRCRTRGRIDAGEAPFLGRLRDLQRVRVLEQRLGGNAAPDQARAAERLLLFDDGDLQARAAPREWRRRSRPCPRR